MGQHMLVFDTAIRAMSLPNIDKVKEGLVAQIRELSSQVVI